MDFETLYKKANAEWLQKRILLSREEIRAIANKNTLRRRLLGVMNSAYYKREKVIYEGEILFAYAFKEWRGDPEEARLSIPTWILFSPMEKINANPVSLKNISAKLQQMETGVFTDKNDKKLQKLLTENLSECSFYPLPSSVVGDSIVYLSVFERPNRLGDVFRLGLNLIISAPSISKEVIMLSPDYWPSELKDAYMAGGIVL